MTKKKPVMLVIMDGFGCSSIAKDNAIAQADLKVLPKLWKEYPHSYLGASGEDVGLPDGQIGNSEVGHLNIGAGRIVYQALTKITGGVTFVNSVASTVCVVILYLALRPALERANLLPKAQKASEPKADK